MRFTVCAGVLALVALGSVVSSTAARAEKVDMTAAQLSESATHVVVGKVGAIYERVSRDGEWRVTSRVLEVAVEAVEKGEGLAAGTPLYARCWTRAWAGRGGPPPSTGGHRGIPKEGERVRIYLARNAYDGFTLENKDGGYNVIGANGFEALPAAPR